MTPTTISDLSWDLVEEILCRVSITSLKAVRSTCKRWNVLFKDQSFTKKHCGKLGKEFMLNLNKIRDGDLEPHTMGFDLHNIKDLPSVKDSGEMLSPVHIHKVYQCDGLLLLFTKDKPPKLVVWNPYLAQTRWIEPKDKYHILDYYAIGYDNKKNHKVLRFYYDFGKRSSVKNEIYDFNSNSWRDFDIAPNRYVISRIHRGVSLKGNTYFATTKRVEIGGFVLCFDFTTESFGPCLHLPFDLDLSEDATLSCIREEQLAACVHRPSTATYEMEIWITTTIEPNAVSWSKFFKVDVLTKFEVRRFFIDKEKKVAIVCGKESGFFCFNEISIMVGEDGYFQETDLRRVFSYVPSLVQI